VLRAAPAPRKLAGTLKRKLFTLTISKVGWATGPNNNVDVQYLAGGRVLIGPEVMDRPEQTATFCDLVDQPHRWTVAIAANDRSMTLAPQDRAAVYTADGQAIGTQTVFTQGHVTWIDGYPVVDNLHFRFTCA
jgi:hypothetical protein